MGEKGHKEDPRYFGGGGKDIWVEAASFQMETLVGFWFFLVKPRAAPAVPVLLWILCCFIVLINKVGRMSLTPTHCPTHLVSSLLQEGKFLTSASSPSLKVEVLESGRFLPKPQVARGKRSSESLTVSQNLLSDLFACSWGSCWQTRWSAPDACLDLSKCVCWSHRFWCFWSHLH